MNILPPEDLDYLSLSWTKPCEEKETFCVSAKSTVLFNVECHKELETHNANSPIPPYDD